MSALGSIATGRLLLGRTGSPLWPESRPDANAYVGGTCFSALCNRAEEYDHPGSSECYSRVPKPSAVEQSAVKYPEAIDRQ